MSPTNSSPKKTVAVTQDKIAVTQEDKTHGSDEIKNKFGKRIYYPQVHKILNRPHNLKLLEVA